MGYSHLYSVACEIWVTNGYCLWPAWSVSQLGFTDAVYSGRWSFFFFYFFKPLLGCLLPGRRQPSKANLTGQTGLSWTQESGNCHLQEWLGSSARDSPAPPAVSARKCKRPSRKGQKAIKGSGQWMVLLTALWLRGMCMRKILSLFQMRNLELRGCVSWLTFI